MFAYYLKSLHIYREQNLDTSNVTSQAYLSLVSSYLEGRYLFGKAMLHQGVRTLDKDSSNLESFWAARFDDEMHQDQIQNWIHNHYEKTKKFNRCLLDAVYQQASGLNALTTEFVNNVERDLPVEYENNLESFKATVISVSEVEMAVVSALEDKLKAQEVVRGSNKNSIKPVRSPRTTNNQVSKGRAQ